MTIPISSTDVDEEWENQTLTEQATEILRYIDSDLEQGLIPDGRVELLRRTLSALIEKEELRQEFDNLLSPAIRGLETNEYNQLLDKLIEICSNYQETE